jgi:hypothetical protein
LFDCCFSWTCEKGSEILLEVRVNVKGGIRKVSVLDGGEIVDVVLSPRSMLWEGIGVCVFEGIFDVVY